MCFQIQVEVFYQRIVLFAAEMRVLDREQTLARTKARLQPLFDILCASQRLEELVIIADILVLSLSWPENAQMFTRLLQVQDLPQPDMGRAHLETGKLFASHSLQSIADEHFKAAERYFKDLGHVYGELDIGVARCSNISGGCQDGGQPEIDNNWGAILYELSTRYKEVSFPIGMIKALLKLGELARLASNFELAYGVAKACSDIAHETGSRFLWIQFQISMLAAALSQIGHEPAVIASGLWLIEEIKMFQTPYFEGMVASILSLACSKLADNSQSVYWAERAKEALEGSTTSEKSLQEYRSAVAKFSQTPRKDQVSQHLQELSSYLNESIEKDVTTKIWKSCADKLVLLAQVEYHKYPDVSALEAVAALEKCLRRALKISEQLEGYDRLEIFASAQSARVQGLMLLAKGETGTEKESTAIECLHSILEVCSSIISPVRRAEIYCQLGPPHWSVFTKTSDHSAAEFALAGFRNAYEIFESLGITEYCIIAMHGISWSLWLTRILDNSPPELDIELLSCFLEMEKWVDLRRNELSTLGTLDSIRTKQQLSSHNHLRDMYSMSLEACVRLGRLDEGWYWIQKSKARSVSDLLGLGIKIPEYLTADLGDNQIAMSLLEEEIAMQKTISELPGEKRVYFRNEMDILRQRMEKHDALRKIMELRKGNATTLSNLQWAFDDKSLPTQNRSIIFVDWSSTPHNDRFFMFVVDESRRPLNFRLDIGVTDVEDWIKAHWLDPDDQEETLNEEDEESPLRELDGLVEKLQFCTKPGDLLVLSPTAVLHSIPLHALRLSKGSHSSGGPMLLVERNPVIYCPSITILEQCVLRAQSRLSPSHAAPPAIFAVYEPQPQEEDYFNTAERTAIYQHANRLSQYLHATQICGNDVTKKSFVEYSTKAPLIHFHGHCGFDSTNVLAQALILGNSSLIAGTQERPKRHPYDTGRLCPESPTDFSVEDIFDLNLSSPHITLIACDSASQKISAGDEPFGILTAFLCAGAASVVGTMWPTATREGRAFSEAFYRCLGNQESVVTGIFDYAGALREAVLAIRGVRDSRLPYYWAPFVLHGAWFGKSFKLGQPS